MILLKVLALTNEFEEESFGGAGTAATGMLNMLDRYGIQQTVIVPRSGWKAPLWILRGQQINVLGLPRNSHYFGRLGMIKTHVVLHEFPELRQKWDLIHSHAINFTPMAYTLSEGLIPIFYSVYSFLRQELGDSPEPELQAQFKIQEELLMRCQHIHLISQSERNYLAERFPKYLSKTEVLPLGISIPQELRRPENANDFLYVGRLLDYKGIEDLIKALYIIRQSGRRFNLNVIGEGPAHYEDHLRKLVQSRGLGDSVKFHGWRPSSEVWQWMASAVCLVIPSHREAYGFVALEGMAIGTPIIASGAGGLAELTSNSCALTYETGNITQLVEVMKKAVDNPALLQSLAAQGRKRALTFEWDQLGPKYLRAYEQVRAKK